jgi:hypothetical protein
MPRGIRTRLRRHDATHDVCAEASRREEARLRGPPSRIGGHGAELALPDRLRTSEFGLAQGGGLLGREAQASGARSSLADTRVTPWRAARAWTRLSTNRSSLR